MNTEKVPTKNLYVFAGIQLLLSHGKNRHTKMLGSLMWSPDAQYWPEQSKENHNLQRLSQEMENLGKCLLVVVAILPMLLEVGVKLPCSTT